MARIVTLTTDFGLLDGYVGTMKAVILSIAPSAEIVDITHHIAPQHVLQGALVLDQAERYFPPGAVHVAIVDPGVGSTRQAIAVRTPDATFIAPDNGILSLVLARQPGIKPNGLAGCPESVPAAIPPTGQRRLPPSCEAIRIDGARVGLPPVGNTFHGRDIFAPAAARASLGIPLSRLGTPLTRVAMFPPPRAHRMPNGTVAGHVVYVDHFGNLITDIAQASLPEDGQAEVAGRIIPRISRSYAEARGLVALVGSAGYLEVAWRNGSAAERLRVGAGTPVTVLPRHLAR